MTAGITNLTHGNHGNAGVHLCYSFSPFEFGRSRPLLRSQVSRLRVPFPPCVRKFESFARDFARIAPARIFLFLAQIFSSHFAATGGSNFRLILRLWLRISPSHSAIVYPSFVPFRRLWCCV
jgi:hypothetical protein